MTNKTKQQRSWPAEQCSREEEAERGDRSEEEGAGRAGDRKDGRRTRTGSDEQEQQRKDERQAGKGEEILFYIRSRNKSF